MILCRMIAPSWLLNKDKKAKKVLEGVFSDEEIKKYNTIGYNVYFLPNKPISSEENILSGRDITDFNFVFVDFDCKMNPKITKNEFIETVIKSNIIPTKIVDSGNGIHVYWKIQNLDAKSYLRFQRRLSSFFITDPAVGQLFQLMRLPNTFNTKKENQKKLCEIIVETDTSYTSEEFDKLLPPITQEDEKYCERHYDKTFNINQNEISEEIPMKFGQLLLDNPEVKSLWLTPQEDRSMADWRIAHFLFANDFTKEEAMSVLVNCVKAKERSLVHRNSYASNIVDSIWTYEQTEDKKVVRLSKSVSEILKKNPENTSKGEKFACSPYVDNTKYGFRLGHVIGLVAGVGVGKTSFALNMFRWFAKIHPDYHHFFVPLEQPEEEIAERWLTMAGKDTSLNDKLHVISNYADNGEFRHMSFDEIRKYILEFQKETGYKIGCVVIDHIGALKKKGKDGENQDLMDICHSMKGFAVETNTLVIMQSQTNREKAGIGDLELHKDAAYGSMYFEAYCDFLITLWQPLKRCHKDKNCPIVTAYKFCKIRHKNVKVDTIQEDVPYYLFYDPKNETLRPMTQDEQRSFNYFLPIATKKRSLDRKTELVQYVSAVQKVIEYDSSVDSNRN